MKIRVTYCLDHERCGVQLSQFPHHECEHTTVGSNTSPNIYENPTMHKEPIGATSRLSVHATMHNMNIDNQS